MALQVCWYDFVCFGIVGVAFFGALWVLWRKEAACRCVDGPPPPESGAPPPLSHVATSQLWTSCWRGVHPACLLATRFLSFLFMLAFLVWDIHDWDASIFIYYTEWTFTLVIVYFALGTIVSAYGCFLYSYKLATENGGPDLEDSRTIPFLSPYAEKQNNGTIKQRRHCTPEEIQQQAGFWGYLMQTAYQTCAGAVILTDIVFWCVIVPFLSNAHLGLNMLMGCMHTLNAVFLLIDAALNSLPFPWFRLAYFVIWSCVYVIFQWVIHACGFTWWPYPFLELNTPWAPLWYLCLAVVHIPCYGIYALIIKAKNTILPRLFPHAFVRSY